MIVVVLCSCLAGQDTGSMRDRCSMVLFSGSAGCKFMCDWYSIFLFSGSASCQSVFRRAHSQKMSHLLAFELRSSRTGCRRMRDKSTFILVSCRASCPKMPKVFLRTPIRKGTLPQKIRLKHVINQISWSFLAGQTSITCVIVALWFFNLGDEVITQRLYRPSGTKPDK